MLSTAEITRMRSTAGAALPDTAIIQSQAWASDGGGGGSLAWTASGTVDCRLAPIGARAGVEREQGDRISPDADSVVTLPFDAAVSEGSRLLINGGTYNIANVKARSWELTTRVEATKET